LHWIFPNDGVQCIRAAIPPSRFQFQPLGSPPIPKTVLGHFELPYWGKLSKQEVNQQNKILIEYMSLQQTEWIKTCQKDNKNIPKLYLPSYEEAGGRRWTNWEDPA
jgi:hypothetical protein